MSRRDRLLAGVLAVNLALLAFYIFVGYRIDFNSDSASKSLVAAEILESGSLYPLNFYFARDLWVLHGHLVILVLAPIIGNGFLANAMSGAVLAVVLLVGFWRMLAYVGVSWQFRVLVLIACSCGFSTEWAEHMFGQSSYGYVCLLLIWVIVASGKYLLDLRPERRHAVVAVLVYVIVGMNGTRGVATYVVPMVAGLLAATVWVGTTFPRRRVFVCAAAVAVGLLLRNIIDGRLAHTLTTETLASYTTKSTLWDNSLLVGLFGLLPSRPVRLTGAEAAFYALRFAFCLGVLTGGIAAISRLATSIGPRVRFFLLFHLTLVIVTWYSLFAVTELAGHPRYLIPVVFTGLVTVGIALESWRDLVIRSGLVTPIAAGLLVLSWMGYVQPTVRVSEIRGFANRSPFSTLLNYLKARDIHYGYATLWTGAAATVLSDGIVRVRPIKLENGFPIPDRYMSARRWYGQEKSGQTALILDRASEVPGFDPALIGGPAPEVADVGRFRLFIYPSNVFAELSPWRQELFELGQSDRVSFDPRFIRTESGVGRLVDGALVASEGDSHAGYLAYGPYAALAAGRYEFAVDVERGGNEGDTGMFWDVAVDLGRRTLINETLTGTGRQTLTRVVTVSETEANVPIETRVYFGGRGILRVFGTRISRLDHAP